MDLTGKTILDRYRVKALLGEGAMGAVYLADDVELNRQVALKVLRRELAERLDVQQRLKNECQIMARLGPHPNIVTLYDRLVCEGDVILVMEYVPGETLSELIERTRMMNLSTEAGKKTIALGGGTTLSVLKVADALDLADQILAGLEFAHSKGVLHRDIKPDNILVTRDHNGRPQAKIMDFGIGKDISTSGEASHSPMLTMIGGPGPGTPAYMAPEQIDPQRFGAVGVAADLYAFGITLYQMLTLSIPFDGTYTELLNAHTNIEPPDPTVRNPAITSAMRAVLVKALRKNQEDRYRSAAEFRMDLAAVGSGGGTVMLNTATGVKTTRPGTPTPVPAPVTASDSSHRRSWVMPCFIGILLLGGGGGIFYLIQHIMKSNKQGSSVSGSPSPTPIQSTPSPVTPIPTPNTPTPSPVTPTPTPIPSTPVSDLWSRWFDLKHEYKDGKPKDGRYDDLLRDAKNANDTGLLQSMEAYVAPKSTLTLSPTPIPIIFSPEQKKVGKLSDEALDEREKLNDIAKKQGKDVGNIAGWKKGVSIYNEAKTAHNKNNYSEAQKLYLQSKEVFAATYNELKNPNGNAKKLKSEQTNRDTYNKPVTTEIPIPVKTPFRPPSQGVSMPNRQYSPSK